MEKGVSFVKLISESHTRFSIDISEDYLSQNELALIRQYLKWIRSGRFGSFEAIKYKQGSEYIDTIISDRTRNPLFVLDFNREE